jgi:hypothetical protein
MKTVVMVILLATLLWLPSLPAAEIPVCRLLNNSDYQSFIKNWDDQKNPVLYALIQTPKQWNAVFHPAPVMGQNKLFSPDPKVYEKESILIVARVIPAPGSGQKVFKLEKIDIDGKTLTLHYQFAAPAESASYTIKDFLGVFVPKGDYKQVIFIENGKPAGSLDITKGQWSVPPMTEDLL